MGRKPTLEALESRCFLSAAASISGLVFNDVDGDGVRDRKERAQPNTRVFLDKNNDGKFQRGKEAAVLTDADGRYRFTALNVGSYSVREVLPQGMKVSNPTSGVYRISISNGRQVTKRNFANVASSKVAAPAGGAVNGAEYNLIGGNGTFSGQGYTDTDTLVKYTWDGDTNFSGTVNFDDYVRVDVGFDTSLTGWSNGDFNYSGAVNFDDYVPIEVAFDTADLVNDPTTYIGVAAVRGSVSGLVFNDATGNGARERNERGLPGTRVILDKAVNGHWQRLSVKRTDADGRYRFEELVAGKYRVRQAPVEGMKTSKPGNGAHQFTLSPGREVTKRNFANSSTS